MALIELLSNSPSLLLTACAILGLLVGSFLNVVILRLPRMMEAGWKQEASAILGLTPTEADPISLMHPASSCPGCGAKIRAWQNIPVVSWLLLRGRCAKCGTSISIQYPLVELAAGLLAAGYAWTFGWGLPLAGALVLAWTLLALAVIDWRTQLLPDGMTLPLLWLGLLLNVGETYVPLSEAVIGAAAGYLLLWLVFHAFRLVTGKEGMGYGDFKLLGALGAWFGWTALPSLILLSSVVGALVGIALMVFKRHDRNIPIAFGPYIAGAGLVMLLFGNVLMPVMP
ncbi:MAG: A24 family peptidase [Gammaproteobacteria bacterium]|nr:A24 family peptidase [Gammaproteobacteria bacterium]